MLAMIPLLPILAFGTAAFASPPAPTPPAEPTDAEAPPPTPPPDGSAPVVEAAAMGTPAAGGDGVLGGIVDGVGSRTDPALIGKITHRVLPKAPAGFVETGLREAACKVRLYVDETGTVSYVVVEDCLEILQAPALAAAYASRFAPTLDENNAPHKV